MTRTQIDRLGERLRSGIVSEADLRMLEEYRRSFAGAYEKVVNGIRQRLGMEPAGRPAKSTQSIIEKLRRESIRLSQVQDIAGCRVVVDDIYAQNQTVKHLIKAFHKTIVVDRRDKPSHGYRAIHVIVKFEGASIEVQVRTVLQHTWAELSEKISDVIDPAVKYGGGPRHAQSLLEAMGQLVTGVELLEQRLFSVAEDQWPDEARETMLVTCSEMESLRRRLSKHLQDIIKWYDKGNSDVISS